MLVEGIQHAFPEDSIVSEEIGTITAGLRTWYIDPIDGTKGFIRKNGEFAIHIGLCLEHAPVLGVVYHPPTRTWYLGIAGQGAYREQNGQRQTLQVTPSQGIEKIIQGKRYKKGRRIKSVLKALQGPELVSSGSEGLRLMYLAENKADIHMNEEMHHCSTWDLCAPQAVLEAAGGMVKFLDGTAISYQGQRKLNNYFLAARDQKTFDKAQNLLRYLLDT